jgi:hypothetical protein
MEAISRKELTSMFGVVSNVFQNNNPFAYTLFRFGGHLREFPVTMML